MGFLWDRLITCEKIKRTLKCTIGFIVIFTVILVAFSLYEIKRTDEAHIRYILSPGMYECSEVVNTETEETETIIKFELNERSYAIPYKDSYFHDGKLYFCEEHQQLE